MSERFGIQEDGTFNKRPVDVIRKSAKEDVADQLGWDISEQNENPVIEMVDGLSIEIARQWDAAEASFYASFYQDAFGEQLDKQLALAGFSRRRLQSATGEVRFFRSGAAPEDIEIPTGTVITTQRTETRPPIPFETRESATILQGETEVTGVPIEAIKPWKTDLSERWLGSETNVQANTINRFDAPVSGVDGVENPLPTGDDNHGFREGRDEETDAEFKLRYQNSLAEGGVSTPVAMESSIFQFDDEIKSVRVEEVREIGTGYGPKPIVFAPNVSPDIVAQAVYESRAAGLESFGNQTGTATTKDGRQKEESFDWATEVTISVSGDISTSDAFPDDGTTQIENNLIRFIGGVAHDDILYPGLDIGGDVIFDQVKKRIMEIRGVVEATVDVDTSDPPSGSSNITVGSLEVAMTGLSNISVTQI